jgi:signal transduction histidine kinase
VASGDGESISAQHGLPHLRLDDLLDELQARIEAIRSTRDRIHSLLEAVLAVGRGGLELEPVLHRIVDTAVALVDARYAAMGIIGEDDQIARFLTVGVTEEEIARIGPYPKGRGILGELIMHPEPLRLHDLSQHPASYGFPPNHPPMKTLLGVPVRVGDMVFGNLYITEKRGGVDFDEEDEQLLSALAAAAGFAIENARLYDEVRRRERWLRASSEISRRLLSGAEPGGVLPLFAAEAMDVADADVAAIAVPVAGTDRLLIEAAVGMNAGQIQGTALPHDSAFSTTVYKSGTQMMTPDARADARAYAAFDPAGLVGPLLAMPLGERDRVRGVLMVGRRAGGIPFNASITDTLTAFSGQAAVALELDEHRTDAEHLTVLHDRDRIAKDLHDLAIQRLFATGMTLEGVTRMIDNPTVSERVNRAVDDIDETIKLIRTTIFALQERDQEFDKQSVRARVLAEVEGAARVLGFAPALRLEGPIDTQVPGEIAENVIAVLREGLSNAARHAKATSIEVGLAVGADVTLRISDNGVGIPATARRRGLHNLAERAKKLDGALVVRPGAERGTVLEWRVPLG